MGYFGKLPFVGDFVRRNLPRGFLQVWDDWLQEGLLASREELGAAWLEFYASAPIWRFALAPGLAGPQAVAGILMPSQDRVNRFFPLTLVTAVDAGAAEAALGDETAMRAMEEAALAALDVEGRREAFDAAIDGLHPPCAPAGAELSGSLWRAVLHGEGFEHRFAGLPPPGAFAGLLDPQNLRHGGAAA
ncbi:MAG: type VI secretion system-associated protein TagF [Alphaproteobacteria bacterium]|nr:MAG: type VI secretion system-associated protein TagF [Alphaproteobacteria bacterium]